MSTFSRRNVGKQESTRNILILEECLADSNADLCVGAFQGLGNVYLALINQGKDVSLSALKSYLTNIRGCYISPKVIKAFKEIFAEELNGTKGLEMAIKFYDPQGGVVRPVLAEDICSYLTKIKNELEA